MPDVALLSEMMILEHVPLAVPQLSTVHTQIMQLLGPSLWDTWRENAQCPEHRVCGMRGRGGAEHPARAAQQGVGTSLADSFGKPLIASSIYLHLRSPEEEPIHLVASPDLCCRVRK